jgi:hypothetical protein
MQCGPTPSDDRAQSGQMFISIAAMHPSYWSLVWVVKPVDFIARGEKALLQPVLKVRGAEYVRIIDGPRVWRA